MIAAASFQPQQPFPTQTTMQTYQSPTPIIAWVPCTCYRDGLTTAPPKWMRKYLRNGYWWMPKGSEKQHARKTTQYVAWSRTACAHPDMLIKVDYLLDAFKLDIYGENAKYLTKLGYTWPKIANTFQVSEQALAQYLNTAETILGFSNKLTIIELHDSRNVDFVINSKFALEVKRIQEHGTGCTLVVILQRRGLCLYRADDLDLNKPPIWESKYRFTQHTYRRKTGIIWALISEPTGDTILLDEHFTWETNFSRVPFSRVDFWVKERSVHLSEISQELKRTLSVFQQAHTHWGVLPLSPLQPEVLFEHLTQLDQKLLKQMTDPAAFKQGLRAFFDETGLICQFEPPLTDAYWTMRIVTTREMNCTAATMFALQEQVQKLLSLQGIAHVHKTVSKQFV
jgi:predicted DNA-binding protein YlxM (UPF0122 family)